MRFVQPRATFTPFTLTTERSIPPLRAACTHACGAESLVWPLSGTEPITLEETYAIFQLLALLPRSPTVTSPAPSSALSWPKVCRNVTA